MNVFSPPVEMQRIVSLSLCSPSSSVLLEILKALVTAPGCPRPAVLIAGSNIYRILDMPFVQRMATVGQLDLDPVKIKIDQLMGLNSRECFTASH